MEVWKIKDIKKNFIFILYVFIFYVLFVLKCCIMIVFVRELIVLLLIVELEYYVIFLIFIVCVLNMLGFLKNCRFWDEVDKSYLFEMFAGCEVFF